MVIALNARKMALLVVTKRQVSCSRKVLAERKLARKAIVLMDIVFLFLTSRTSFAKISKFSLCLQTLKSEV